MTTTLPDLSTHPPAVGLLQADADFARAVPEEERDLAARTLVLPRRAFAAGDVVACEPDDVALLVIRGAVWRELRVGRGASPQLLGPGSILLCDPRPAELLSATMRATALSDCDVAVLDGRFLLGATKWPGLLSILHARVSDQQRDLAIQAAICQFPRVDERIVALLWHLAERWGKVGPDGVRLPIALTHATLGRFVGARRPTVSIALAELREVGSIDRDETGGWILRGDPPGPAPDSATPPPDAVARLL